MFSTQAQQSLNNLFSNAAQQAEQLFALLEKEQNALLSDDYADLEGLAEQKLNLSQQLDNVETQRQEIMQQAGLVTDISHMPELLQAQPQSRLTTSLLESWEALVVWLKKAADQNQLNGILLEKQRQHVQSALRILFEQTGSTSVYDSNGSTPTSECSRSVGVV